MICFHEHFFDKLPLFRSLRTKYMMIDYIGIIDDVTNLFKQLLINLCKNNFIVDRIPKIVSITFTGVTYYQMPPDTTYNIKYIDCPGYGIVYDRNFVLSGGSRLITNDIEKLVLLDKIVINSIFVGPENNRNIEIHTNKFPSTNHELFTLISRAKFLASHDISPLVYDKCDKYIRLQNPLSLDEFSNFQKYPLVENDD